MPDDFPEVPVTTWISLVSLTLAGMALPMPDADGGITVDELPIAVKRRMYSGLMRVDHTAVKHRITLRWTLLSQALWAALDYIYNGYLVGSCALMLPNRDTYTVVLADNGLNHTRYTDPLESTFYSTSLVLEEV